MAQRDLVVIGGSAGAIEPLRELVRGLPAGFAGAVLVVIHIPAEARSVLPSILERGSKLPVAHAIHGEQILPGRVYVAPPNQHLLVHHDRVRLWHGPRENGHRPAIDTLFRTAARWYGPRVIGVALSGVLDDGAAGMFGIKSRGGLAIAQDPEDALYAGIPQSVINHVSIDNVAPAGDLAALLIRYIGQPVEETSMSNEPTEQFLPETESLAADPEIDAVREERAGPASGFTCPDCHGALWEVSEGTLERYRCRVGHGFSGESLAMLQEESVEEAMWVAYRALEESAAISRRLVERAERNGHHDTARRYSEKLQDTLSRAHVVRDVLARSKRAAG